MKRFDAILVFARAPVSGQVKTRLANDIGDAAALAAYERLGRACWDSVLGARRATGCRAHVVYTPENGEARVRGWLSEADVYEAQQGGDLGDRMSAAVAAALGGGARRVVLVGTDCPALSASLLVEAFAALDDADVVLGPATDGGYYLIGMASACTEVFADVPWSTARTLEVTLLRAAAAGLRVKQLERLSDVDTAADWRAWTRAATDSRISPG